MFCGAKGVFVSSYRRSVDLCNSYIAASKATDEEFFGYILRGGLCFIDVSVDALRCKSTTLRGYKLRQAVHARRDAVL